MTVSFLRPSATRGSHAPAALRDMIFIRFRTGDPSLGNFDLVACGYAPGGRLGVGPASAVVWPLAGSHLAREALDSGAPG